MKRRLVPALLAVLVLSAALPAPADTLSAAQKLIGRVLPEKASLFTVEEIPQEAGRDVFEIEGGGGTVTLRGSSGVAVASALNWYLKHHCHANVSWRGTQTTLPDPLPAVSPKVRRATPLDWRYCFNYCCFSYSLAWWDWAEWERIIDWMAMNGVNMPLAVTGQESVWAEVGKSFGLTQADMDAFFVGPGYLPFGWMGCMDGWGGPLPTDWTARHAALQKRIVARERELGMKPVLQGFTGHVPAALKNKFPDATFQQLPSWCGFPGTLFVDPQDPLFVKVGKAFVEEQTRQFGTDHLYAADTFIEMSPPSDDPAFLDAMGKAVFEAMRAGDPEAVWIMQGWLFVNNPGYWKAPQTKALLTSVPDDRMTVLDLHCEDRPAWKITESFHGKPWIWCVIQDFGDVVSMHGGLPRIAADLPGALNDPARGSLRGAGIIMEGLGYNPVVNDLLSDLFWDPVSPDLNEWIQGHARQRYGKSLPKAEAAWKGFLNTVYRQSGRGRSVVCMRPALDPKELWGGGPAACDLAALAAAWGGLAACAPELRDVDAYQYDLVHVTRQVLSDLAGIRLARTMKAHAAKDADLFSREADAYLELFDDLDRLLATRGEFLLGRWLEDAKRWGADDKERALLEWNARTQITLWGPPEGVLHDYAQKHWAGLVRDFYRPRWEQFLSKLESSLRDRASFDGKAFTRDLQQWEDAWTRRTDLHAAAPSGNAAEVSLALWEKYHAEAAGK